MLQLVLAKETSIEFLVFDKMGKLNESFPRDEAFILALFHLHPPVSKKKLQGFSLKRVFPKRELGFSIKLPIFN